MSSLSLCTQALHSIPEGVLFLEPGLRISFANDAVTRLLGVDKSKDVLGMTLEDFYEIPVELSGFVDQLAENATWQGELVLASDGEGRRVHECSATQLQGDRLFLLLRNVTSRKEDERLFRETRERVQLLAQHVPGMLYLCRYDEDMTVLYLNDRVEELIGYNKDEFLSRGLHFSDLYHSDEKEKLQQEIRNAIDNHRGFQFEYCMRHRDGDWRWVSDVGVPVFKDGVPYLLEGYITDITARKESEAKLKQSQKMLQLVMDNIPQQVFWKDSNSIYLGCNMNFAIAAGAESPKEVIGKTDYDLWSVEEANEYRTFDKRVLKNNAPEYRIQIERIRDGQRRWGETNKVPLPDAEGVTAGVLGTYEDITSRIEAEEALRKSEERLKGIISSQGDIIFEMDRNGVFTFVSASCRELLGYAQKELVGECFFNLVRGDSVERSMRAYQTLLETGRELRSFRTEWYHLDGTTRHMSMNARAILDSSGKPEGSRGAIRDITEIIELEEQLRHAQKMEAIGELAGGVAHDFNNLLTGIIGYADLLQLDPAPDEEVREIARMIDEAAVRAQSLTGQLLGFARRGKHQNIPVELHRVVDEVEKLLARTFDKHIEIHKALNAPHATVIGDPVQVQQVLLNLAINARDAMQGREPAVLTFATGIVEFREQFTLSGSRLAPGEYLLISVSDTGCGIDESLRSRVFEPFFTTKEPGKGTGMGLAMVYGIVTNHGGSLSVHSTVGDGTTFEVYLPLAAADSKEVISSTTQVAVRGVGRILVIDDQKIVRDVGREMLQRLGYEVITVADGKEALEVYKREGDKINLVLLDLIMPSMSGADCFLKLKEFDPDVSVVLMTGYGLNNEAQRLIDQGVQGFIQKPYRLSQLSQVVSETLSRQQVRTSIPQQNQVGNA